MNITNNLLNIFSNKSDTVAQIKIIQIFIENHLLAPLVILALINNLMTIITIMFLIKTKQSSAKHALTFYLFIGMADICAVSPFVYKIFGM